MMPALLDLQNVTFYQQPTEILRGIDWSVAEGERWAVLGPNGSGKTTLLKIATGALWHTGGIARRRGEELIDLSEFRQRIGWVSADLMARVPPREKAIATVVSGRRGQVGLRRIGGEAWPTEADFAEAYALLDAMGIRSVAEKPVRVLSQGERQQVLVARARMSDAVLLILDEPCAGMDPGTRERFLGWLGQQMERSESAPSKRPAIVMITHQVEEVLPEFDQVLLMAEGRVVASGSPAEALTAESLSATYSVNVARVEHNAGRHWPIWGAR